MHWKFAAAMLAAWLPATQAGAAGTDILNQSDYELAQTCIGALAGSVEVFARLLPAMTDPPGKSLKDVLAGSQDLLNNSREDLKEIEESEPFLDRAAGTRAYRAGYAPWASIAGQSEHDQYDYWTHNGSIGPDCQDILQYLPVAAAVFDTE